MTKSASDVDRHVGSRVRLQRQILGLTQSALAERLGVSFQQVQKYEKGANRIGASRLQQIAQALRVPISSFYEGAPNSDGTPAGDESSSTEVMARLLSHQEGLRLMSAFSTIQQGELRLRLVEMAETLAALELNENRAAPEADAD